MDYARCVLAELLGKLKPSMEWTAVLKMVPGFLMTDCMSLHDMMKKVGSLTVEAYKLGCHGNQRRNRESSVAVAFVTDSPHVGGLSYEEE